ncbi:MAG: hypothetical protein ACK5L3_08645 [Oscillospiraceae bacterium]
MGEYRKIIAVDFDGTLCEHKYPEIGAPNRPAITALLEQQANGALLILWTCREGDLLQAAVLWCINHGLHFDTVNANIPANVQYFGTDSRKVYAHEYWDDRARQVAAANDDLPAIPAELERLQAENAALKARLEKAVEWGADLITCNTDAHITYCAECEFPIADYGVDEKIFCTMCKSKNNSHNYVQTGPGHCTTTQDRKAKVYDKLLRTCEAAKKAKEAQNEHPEKP